jgi:DNA-binding NtrC family response regulator
VFSVPRLLVISLTDSFADFWPTLASHADLELVSVGEDDASALLERPPADGQVVLAVGGGAEDRLESVLRRISHPAVEIAAIASEPNHRLAAALVRAGATEFFALPGDVDVLKGWVRERAERLRSAVAGAAFAAAESRKYRFDGIIGTGQALEAALDRAARIIPHANVTVLIQGETGTGKELVARAIHYNGPRKGAPFVDINCAAIPEQLLESELFGHEKGAFTGAIAAKPGLFELANGGTLFLDEIGHLSLPLQGKLLRALEERGARRVGGSRSISFDVRVIAATHVDLAEAVRQRAFREDLYFRLNVVPITLPPLRARRGDVLPLARHFLSHYASEYGLPVPQLTSDATAALSARPWPGNVRELRNLMERTLLLSGKTTLDANDVASEASPSIASSTDSDLPVSGSLREIVRAVAARTLARCGGNKSQAARELAISRTRLQRLLDAANDSADPETDTPDSYEREPVSS